MPEPKKKKPRKDEDEITIAKSILDEIIEETESEENEEEERPEPKPAFLLSEFRFEPA